MNILPPLTGTPLDYVPIDAPAKPTTPTVFTAPFIRRSILAAFVAAIVVACIAFPSFGAGVFAIGAMFGFVWGGNRVADYMNEQTAEPVVAANWWQDPFSWWPTIVILIAIWAIVYFS